MCVVCVCLFVGKCLIIVDFLIFLNFVYLVCIVFLLVYYIDYRFKKENLIFDKKLIFFVFMYFDINVWNILIILFFVLKLFLNGFIIINFFLNFGLGCRYKKYGFVECKIL